MAMQIKWKRRAQNSLRSTINYSVDNWGERVAVKFYQKLKVWTDRLRDYPELGRPEPLLAERKRLYRSLIIDNHQKLVYYVDESEQVIYIVDLWDMRREPAHLVSRFL